MMEYHRPDPENAEDLSARLEQKRETSVAEDAREDIDQPAGVREVANFKRRLEEGLAAKALGLGIETKADLNELVDLLALDLGYFEQYDPANPDGRDADESAWTRRDLLLMEDNVAEALAEIRRGEDKLEAVSDPGTLEKLTDFLARHHHLLSLGELALIASSFGSSYLQSLAQADARIQISGYDVPLGDMMKYPEIAQKMNQLGDEQAGEQHFGQYGFSDMDLFSDHGTMFSFNVFRGAPQTLGHNSADPDEHFVQRIYLSPINVEEEKLHQLNDHLKSQLGISLAAEDNGCSLEEFSEHRDEIARCVAEDLGVDETRLAENIDGFIGYDANNVALVELDDFRIDPEVHPSDNFDSLKIYEKELAAGPDHAQFRGQFLQLLQDSDVDLEQLKATAATHPEAAIQTIMEVISTHVDYDTAQEDFDGYDWIDQHDTSNQAALQVLESGHANCWAWMTLCIDAKVALEEAGVPNLDKLACFPAYSSEIHHVWVAMATETAGGGVSCTAADPAMDGLSGNNAVDGDTDFHSYAVGSSAFCRAALERMQELQAIHKAEEALRAMQSDPALGRVELPRFEEEDGAADAGEPMLERILERISRMKAERDALAAVRRKLG